MGSLDARALAGVLLVAAFASAVFVGSVAALAPDQEAPYDGCGRNPETCDPVVANDSRIKSGSEPTRVILYGHFQDLLQRAPVNTQPPHPQYEQDVNAGFLMPTLYVANQDICCNFPNNEFTMFSSANLVEYTGPEQWRVYQLPNLPYPLQFASKEIVGYWYMSPRSVPDAAQGANIGAMPAVGVYMRVETGYLPGTGELIAEGDTGTGYQTSGTPQLGGTVHMVSEPGGDVVYEFRVPMEIVMPTLPFVPDAGWATGPGFVVTVIPYQIEYNNEVAFTQSDWRLRTGADYPPRLVADVLRPLRTVKAEILQNPEDPALMARWHVQSVFGAYDVDVDSFRLNVTLPDGTPFEPQGMVRDVRYATHHAGSFQPINVTWRLPAPDGRLPDGTYHLTASVMNLQGTYELVWEQDVKVRNGYPLKPGTVVLEGETRMPGPALAAVLAGVAAAAVLVRRRD